jgi:ribulose-phosphate 3-epimerase
MKISASIYSNKDKELSALINELDAYRVNYFHVDCNNDISVFDDIRAIRNISKTPVDLHLITSEPEKFFASVCETDVEYLTLQYESLREKPRIPEEFKGELGLAIVSDTPVEVFEQYKDCCSFILFMATTPGMSGGKFDKQNFKKIQQFKNNYPGLKIHVDGGINEELSFILRNMGVDSAVIGSYLFHSDFIGSAMLRLNSNDIESHYRVRDFMMDYDEIPIVEENSATFIDVLKTIDQYKMGFTSIAGTQGEMKGIITNADIRKCLIRNFESIAAIDVNEMINRDPAFVFENETVSDVLNYIKSLNFPVLFLPVVDENRKITGAIKFNNLIKGES